MAQSTALAKFGTEGKTFAAYVGQNKAQLRQAAASHVDIKRLYRVTCAVVTRTPALQMCSVTSIFRSMQQAAELGLEPGSALGEAYLVPYQDRRAGTSECQLIIGYRGLIALARRSGHVGSISAFVVYESDTFEVELGMEPRIVHRPSFCEPNPNKIIYAYAIARLKEGGVQFDVMTRQEIEAIRGRSRAGNNGPWVTDFAEMAKKTVVRRLAKYLPMSIEMARAVEIDEVSEFGEWDSNVTPVNEQPTLPPNVNTETGEVVEDDLDLELDPTEGDEG